MLRSSSSSLSMIRSLPCTPQKQRIAFATRSSLRLESSQQLLAYTTLRRLQGWHHPSSSLILAGQRDGRPTMLCYSTSRALSSTSNNNNNNNNTNETTNKTKSVEDAASKDGTTSELVLTPGEKVVVASRLLTWSGILALVATCTYYIGKELFPSKMSPNRVFDKAFQVIKEDMEVKRRFGDVVKAYGRDHGGHREGRRNFIEHTEYVSQEDSNDRRTRIRFNVEFRHGAAFVFAEVSSKMNSNEFVYVLVQDKQTGRVITVIDNRAVITAARLAGDNKEGLDAMRQLLSGDKKN